MCTGKAQGATKATQIVAINAYETWTAVTLTGFTGVDTVEVSQTSGTALENPEVEGVDTPVVVDNVAGCFPQQPAATDGECAV